MDQRTFIIIFVVITIIAVGGLAFSRFANSTPPPTTQDGLSSEQNQQNQMQNSQNKSQQTGNIKQYPQFPGVLPKEQLSNKKAVIQTDKGVIEFEIYPEATKAASNFIFLSQDKFYDGLIFHRVENWVIQGGDPTGTGSGGPGYRFEDEPVTRQYTKGAVAMANAGPDTNGSQFFILTRDTPLQPNYTIFGKVLRGQEVVDKISVGDVMRTITISPLK